MLNNESVDVIFPRNSVFCEATQFSVETFDGVLTRNWESSFAGHPKLSHLRHKNVWRKTGKTKNVEKNQKPKTTSNPPVQIRNPETNFFSTIPSRSFQVGSGPFRPLSEQNFQRNSKTSSVQHAPRSLAESVPGARRRRVCARTTVEIPRRDRISDLRHPDPWLRSSMRGGTWA